MSAAGELSQGREGIQRGALVRGLEADGCGWNGAVEIVVVIVHVHVGVAVVDSP